ncbi:MAG: hypothetical protein E7394_00280 [Ruminococcaceae bacterium]|nr:hypothetical protein [Oscillospiraceae bacterium]
MAMKICPVCKKEYDDLELTCPYCGYVPQEAEEDSVISENTDDSVINENTEDSVINENTEDSESIDVQTDNDEEGKNNKTLKIIAGVLVVILVALAAFLVYTKFIAPRRDGKVKVDYVAKISEAVMEDTIKDVDGISAKELDGTFSDQVNGVYFTFTAEKKSVQNATPSEQSIPDDTIVDSAADSAAGEQVESDVVIDTVEYDGTYVSGMTQKRIRDQVIMNFIETEYLYEQYNEYIKGTGSLKDDFEGFIKANGYEDRVNEFDVEKGISQELAFDTEHGYFKIEEGFLKLFGETGTEIGKFKITSKGLVDMSCYYEREKSTDEFYTVYSIEMDNYGETQKVFIRMYSDGYFIYEPEGMPEYVQAGTYKVEDDGIYASIGGSVAFFYVTDSGISNVILTK